MLEQEWKHKHGWKGLTSWQKSEGGESLESLRRWSEQRQLRFRGPPCTQRVNSGRSSLEGDWAFKQVPSQPLPAPWAIAGTLSHCWHPEPLPAPWATAVHLAWRGGRGFFLAHSTWALCELASHMVIVLRANNSDREWNSSKAFPVPNWLCLPTNTTLTCFSTCKWSFLADHLWLSQCF